MFLLRIGIVLLIFGVIHERLLAEESDSLAINNHQQHLGRFLILPTALGAAGMIVKETSIRESFQNYIQNSSLRTNTTIDDYIQYAPIVEIYAADIYYSKDANLVFQQTKNLAIAELFTAVIVQTIKKTTNVRRPNGHEFSFFSGHTSQSFTGATALYLEYKDENLLYALSGYGFSTATGILRITNNKHWLSDVLVGAGIGMVSSRLTWYINPFSNWKPFKKNKNQKVALYPFVNGLSQRAGLNFVF